MPPPRAVLLTFDDGYASLYTRVYPLLKTYGYPAVFALVSSWLETPAGDTVDYGNGQKPRSAFITWAQAREMATSDISMAVGVTPGPPKRSVRFMPITPSADRPGT